MWFNDGTSLDQEAQVNKRQENKKLDDDSSHSTQYLSFKKKPASYLEGKFAIQIQLY